MSGFTARAAIDNAGHQPAAADRNDDRVEVRRVLEHFEPDRARAGDDLRVVERSGRRRSRSRAPARAPWRKRRRTSSPCSTTVGAVALGLRHLHRRRRLRHDDGRRNAEPLGMIGDRLRVIAGRRRDHAARALLRRQLQQFVERAALLVGGGELQILELQPDLGADDFGQGPADQHRRPDDRALDALGGGADVVDRRGLQHRHARPSASLRRRTMLCGGHAKDRHSRSPRRSSPRRALADTLIDQCQRHPGRCATASCSISPAC